MGVTNTANLLFAVLVVLFLITFFAPGDAATIYCQTVLLFIIMVEIAGNALITGTATIVFVVQGFLDSVFFFIDLDPETVLVYQADSLRGWGTFIVGLKEYLGTIATNFEGLLAIEIEYKPYQPLEEMPEIVIKHGVAALFYNSLVEIIIAQVIIPILVVTYPAVKGGIDAVQTVVETPINVVQTFVEGSVRTGQLLIDGMAKTTNELAKGDLIGAGQAAGETAIDTTQSAAQTIIDTTQAGVGGVIKASQDVVGGIAKVFGIG